MVVETPIPSQEAVSRPGELAYRLRQQQLTAEYGLFALKCEDLAVLLEEASRSCAKGLQSEFCKALEYLPDEHRFLVRAGVGWGPGIVGHARIGADLESPAGYAFQTGQPVISNHLQGESRFRTPELLVQHGVKRAINVLIQGEGDRFGVLEVDSPDGGRFSEADLAFLQGFANVLGAAIERQKIEKELRDHEKLLRQAVAHQQVLTREISHRVKNSLSIVGGLLRMQGRASPSQDVKRALEDAQARVQTIAQVHDRLWRTDEVLTVDLSDFLGELCEQFRAAGPSHALTCDIAPVTIATDQAVSLGLLANELVTNAFKYAYPGGSGDVRLLVKALDAGHLRFEVSDRGIGLPADFDVENSTSLGIRLVKSLAAQLGGEITWRNTDPGTQFTLDFPRQEPLVRER